MMKFTDNPRHKDNVILKLSFEFAVDIVLFSELLQEKKKFAISNQLIRSGTSIGANIKEAQNAESKADFIHKLKIASKEAEETEYWLFICNEVDSYPDASQLIEKLISINKILNKIIGTTKRI